MFGNSVKKSKNEDAGIDSKLSVYTIPSEFYGGTNPVIKFRNVEQNIGPASVATENKIATSSVPISKPNQPVAKSAAGFFGNWKHIALLAGLMFFVFLAGASFYYWQKFRPTPVNTLKKPAPVVNQNPVSVVVPTPVITSTPVVTPDTPVLSPSTTQALSGGVLEFPSVLLGTSADLDRDGLTDVEEDLFTTDPGKADTDGDGYEDGTEVYYLYSPVSVAPARLASSGLVKEFVNPQFNYKIYYPSSWVAGNVDPEYRDMLFSTVTGENIEVRVFDKKPLQTFDDWFAEWAKGEQLGSLKDFSTVFKGMGRVRTDNLVYYFEDQNHIFVVLYHVTGSGSANYKDVITMIARSFRLPSEQDAILPEQAVIREAAPSNLATSTTPSIPATQ